jgi:hypothetical protein
MNQFLIKIIGVKDTNTNIDKVIRLTATTKWEAVERAMFQYGYANLQPCRGKYVHVPLKKFKS